MEVLNELLSQLDPKAIYIAVAVVFLLGVISFIKKAIKLGVLIFVIAFAISTLGPMAKGIQEKYDFNVNNGIATIQVDGNTFELNKDTVKNVEFVKSEDDTYTLKVTTEKGPTSATIPSFMVDGVKIYLNKYNIPFQLIEDVGK